MKIKSLLVIAEQILFSLTTFVMTFMLVKILSVDDFAFWIVVSSTFFLLIGVMNSTVWAQLFNAVSLDPGRPWGIVGRLATNLLLLTILLIATCVVIFFSLLDVYLLLVIVFYFIASVNNEYTRKIYIAGSHEVLLFINSLFRVVGVVLLVVFYYFGFALDLVFCILLLVVPVFIVQIMLLVYEVLNQKNKIYYFLRLGLVLEFSNSISLLKKSLLQYVTNQGYVLVMYALGFNLMLTVFEIIRNLFNPIVVLGNAFNNIYFKGLSVDPSNVLLKRFFLKIFLFSVLGGGVVFYFKDLVFEYVLVEAVAVAVDNYALFMIFAVIVVLTNLNVLISNYFLCVNEYKAPLSVSKKVFLYNLVFAVIAFYSYEGEAIFYGTFFVQLMVFFLNTRIVFRNSSVWGCK